MKKNSIITVLAVLVLITVVVASIVAGTYARYANTTTGTATVVAANWSFAGAMKNGGVEVTTLNLYDTMTTPSSTYPNLTANTIAPGTSGSFDISLDGTGSEVGIAYSIKLELASGTLPTGLTFKIDGNAIPTEGLTGKIPLANVGTAVTKTVTWEWALGDDAAATAGINNDDDTFEGTINVTIRGEQYLGAI